MVNHFAQLPSRFCQIAICYSRTGQTVEWQNQSQLNHQPHPVRFSSRPTEEMSFVESDDENQSTIKGEIGGWPRPETRQIILETPALRTYTYVCRITSTPRRTVAGWVLLDHACCVKSFLWRIWYSHPWKIRHCQVLRIALKMFHCRPLNCTYFS